MKKHTGLLLLLSFSFFYISCSPEVPEVIDVVEDASSKNFLSQENVKFKFNSDTLKSVNTKRTELFFGKINLVVSYSFDADPVKQDNSYKILDMNEFSEEDRQRIEE